MIKQESTAIVASMKARQDELVQDALARSGALGAKARRPIDPTYMNLLPVTLCAAYGFFVGSIECGSSYLDPVPGALLTQTQTAAAVGIPLDELLLRCLAVNSLLTVYLSQEAERASVSGNARIELATAQVASFERVMDAVVAEFQRAVLSRAPEKGGRVALVRGLLAGELLSLSALAYDFSYSHVAVLAPKDPGRVSVARLAKALDARPLLVEPDDSTVWAWLGTRDSIQGATLKAVALESFPEGIPVALGCSEDGLRGWRASHLQAKSAFLISTWRETLLHYEDVALEASAIQNKTLSEFLRQTYVIPIKKAPSEGAALFATLRAYLETERNGVSAAASLGVSRQTVSNRLRLVEKHLGCPLSSCADKVELALRLDEIERSRAAAGS